VAKIRLQISATSVTCARTSSATTVGSLLMMPPNQLTVATNSMEQTPEGRAGQVAQKGGVRF
jgi:hypothetical protein